MKIHIKLYEWQISSLTASSIKNLPTCLSVPLGVSTDFRSVVHQNGQSKAVGTTWWHSGTIVQHDRWIIIHRLKLLLIWRPQTCTFCSYCGGTDVLVAPQKIKKTISTHYFHSLRVVIGFHPALSRTRLLTNTVLLLYLVQSVFSDFLSFLWTCI